VNKVVPYRSLPVVISNGAPDSILSRELSRTTLWKILRSEPADLF